MMTRVPILGRPRIRQLWLTDVCLLAVEGDKAPTRQTLQPVHQRWRVFNPGFHFLKFRVYGVVHEVSPWSDLLHKKVIVLLVAVHGDAVDVARYRPRRRVTRDGQA